MAGLPRYAWLIAGAAAAIVVPLFDLGSGAAAVLHAVVPLPWHEVGTGALWFLAAAALYFRRSWIGTIEELDRERERHAAAARLLEKILVDGRRSRDLIEENLAVLADGDQRPAEARLYLEGARSHADKLEQVFERIDGVRRRLQPEGGES